MASPDERPDTGAGPIPGRITADDAQDLASPPWAANATLPAAGGEDDQEIWLLSYSDLVTLLLSVFVMLLAITTLKDQLPTTPQPELPVAASNTASNTAAVHTAPESAPPPPLFDEPPPPKPNPPPDPRPRLDDGKVAVTAPERVAAHWRETLATLGVPRSVAVDVRQNRVNIVIGDGILFASGRAELTPGGDGLLRRLAPTLTATRGDIVVEGHTDRTPISNSRFPSNWELSGARASSVVRRLIELGLPPDRLSAVGFADTRPLTGGTDPVAQARNRRVAITLQADDEPGTQPGGPPAAAPSPTDFPDRAFP
ncbi:flagellar motor protein MotB [Azospirillum sp. TSO35-2]|uniref:OmpA/MotB family protein n=1 Tax=Azospirillum sp. TSO35-2 TaxID=716796 RepID=UPI000D64FFF6|nr:flagellar motor protein MotB [Azospirillum sp. TSO35-2]